VPELLEEVEFVLEVTVIQLHDLHAEGKWFVLHFQPVDLNQTTIVYELLICVIVLTPMMLTPILHGLLLLLRPLTYKHSVLFHYARINALIGLNSLLNSCGLLYGFDSNHFVL
jgi:hypothetical protein